MAIKFVSSPGSAYETAPGVTAEEAHDAGLAIVEYAYGTNPPAPIYGRYKDAPKGHPLGVTVAVPGDTRVIGTGSVGAIPAPAIGGDKGSLLNTNDPVIHGGTGDESVHADNAPPLVDNAEEQTALLREGAVDPLNPEPAPKSKK